MRTAISGCKITYFVDKMNTKQYELRNKPEHDKKNTGRLEGVTLNQRYTYYRFLRAMITNYFKRMQDGRVLQFLSTYSKGHTYVSPNKTTNNL